MLDSDEFGTEGSVGVRGTLLFASLEDSFPFLDQSFPLSLLSVAKLIGIPVFSSKTSSVSF